MVCRATARCFQRSAADAFEAVRQTFTKILDPFGAIGLGAAFVVVVRGANRDCFIICTEIAGIILFQGIQALKVVAAQMQNQRRKQSRRATVAVIVRMNGGELVVGDANAERAWQRVPLRRGNPSHQSAHQRSYVLRFRRQVDNSAAPAIPNDILPVAIPSR